MSKKTTTIEDRIKLLNATIKPDEGKVNVSIEDVIKPIREEQPASYNYRSTLRETTKEGLIAILGFVYLLSLLFPYLEAGLLFIIPGIIVCAVIHMLLHWFSDMKK
jgi:hypothetical protein